MRLQWHITNQCNLRCRHCYQETYDDKELDYRQLLAILQQYADLLEVLSNNAGTRIRGRIRITGGEPFVRNDCLQLLQHIAKHKKIFSLAILTNGSLINRKLSRFLHHLSPEFVQLSIEGSEKTHDAIRGHGSYAQTVQGIKHLVTARVPVILSFTAHKNNFREFADVARIGRQLGVKKVWADRMLPYGQGKQLKDCLLSPAEHRQFLESIAQTQKETSPWWKKNKTVIAMDRALQFLVSGSTPYRCTAGDSLIAVMPDGELLPCRRMPISVGNLRKSSLESLYFGSEIFQALRDSQKICSGCEGCAYATTCRGGLKCLSYALYKDPFQADPGCWRKNMVKPIRQSQSMR